MAALNTGVRAPLFALPTVDGADFSLEAALKRGPVVLAFFKISCPVCQYAMPFVERLFRTHHGAKATVVGISQDNLRDSKAFMREYNVSFPVALDETSRYPVSSAYGLTNVPTLFYVAGDGEIEISSVGWSKSDMEAIHRKLSEHRGQAAASFWRKGEQVQDSRAG